MAIGDVCQSLDLEDMTEEQLIELRNIVREEQKRIEPLQETLSKTIDEIGKKLESKGVASDSGATDS